MKRVYSSAFPDKDLWHRLPPDCENLVISFLPLRDVASKVTVLSQRFRGLALAQPHWGSVHLNRASNQNVQRLLRAHGRKFRSLKLCGMRISRGICQSITQHCVVLERLDLVGVWNSPALNIRFTKTVATLPCLKSLKFGTNNVCAKGMKHLCLSLKDTLEELDFNARNLPTSGFYPIEHLKKLKSLTLRSSNHVDLSVVERSVCTLPNLKHLHLCFLPRLSRRAVGMLCETIGSQLVTLVLNGMFLLPADVEAIGKRMPKLEILSLCHHRHGSTLFENFYSASLRILMVFHCRQMRTFSWVKGLERLQVLCLYRCSFQQSTLHNYARNKGKHILFRIFSHRPIRNHGVQEEDIEFEEAPNVISLTIFERPRYRRF